MNPRSIILAIETAIGGGSISVLCRDGAAIGTLAGVSRAEDLLIGIDRLLADCNVSRDTIDMIAVSLGPGSFTGIRIGIATAIGLESSFGVRCVGVNAFEAISLSYPKENVVVVLPLGRGYSAFQKFSLNGAVGDPHVVHEKELVKTLGERSDMKFVFYLEAGSSYSQWKALENYFTCTEPLSTLVGRHALARGGEQDLKPLYLRNKGMVGVLADRGSV
jgi:tRNA threonylcarbamoyl adenosine modification protein YeaZ